VAFIQFRLLELKKSLVHFCKRVS